jgi:hypothetical protein
MSTRGNDWPIDPTQTTGTELATVLNRMVDALDSTNHTDNTGDRPDYAVKGTLWLDGDVSEQNLGLKMFTGAADALLFDINDQTGDVTHTWRQVDFIDETLDFGPTPYGSHIRQVGAALICTAPDATGLPAIRSWSSGWWGLNVDGKLNIGFQENAALNVNTLTVQPQSEGGVRFWTTNTDGEQTKNLMIYPSKLSGGVWQGTTAAESLSTWMYGTRSSFATVDGSSTGAVTGFYCGNAFGDYWSALGNDGGNNGANTMTLQIRRQASNNDFAKYSVGGILRSRISASGQVYGTGEYVDLSDAETKTVAADLGINPQSIVMALNVRKYTRETGGGEEFGFVANEVQAILPSAVVSFEGENYKEEAVRLKKGLWEAHHEGEVAPPSILSDVVELNAPEYLGLQKGQINAILLAHVQDLTRRLEALEGA